MVLIFTDLDGTLLDFDTYSFEDAKKTIEALKEKCIPIVIVTSKTRSEVEDIREKLGINDPFIVENGGGIFFEKGYRNFYIPNCKSDDGFCIVRLGKSYEEVRDFFLTLKKKFPVIGFGDLSVDEIMELTGLDLESASKAKRREFSEPFIAPKSMLPKLKKFVEEKGFNIIEGGRFFHLISSSQSKGKAVKFVVDVFCKNLKVKVISIGLGDSPNDEDMLNSVDIPIQIPHPGNRFVHLNVKHLRKAKFPGSKGWGDSVKEVLDELKGDC